MKINVNDLLASPVLKSLIQLSSSRKEQLIDYPSTVVIVLILLPSNLLSKEKLINKEFLEICSS